MRDRAEAVIRTEQGYVVEQMLDPRYPENFRKVRCIGGKIEQGETPQQAICRELAEEYKIEASEVVLESVTDGKQGKVYRFLVDVSKDIVTYYSASGMERLLFSSRVPACWSGITKESPMSALVSVTVRPDKVSTTVSGLCGLTNSAVKDKIDTYVRDAVTVLLHPFMGECNDNAADEVWTKALKLAELFKGISNQLERECCLRKNGCSQDVIYDSGRGEKIKRWLQPREWPVRPEEWMRPVSSS
jgi:hypothetical protein